MVLNNIIFGEPWNKFTRKWCKTVGLCSQSNPDSLSPQSNRREVWSIISKVTLIIFML
jgi:hypothetical protein